MKPRARRITIGAAAIVAGVVAVLAVANWSTLRDHVEVWHFQLTRQTETFQPLAPSDQGDVLYGPAPDLQILATYSNLDVIHDPVERNDRTLWSVGRDSMLTMKGYNSTSRGSRWGVGSLPMSASKEQNVVSFLRSIREKGFRILEQRFPWRAYVVIRDDGGSQPSYVVQKGDTLARIAKKVYGDLAKFQLIEQANPDIRYRTLQVGERIKVPALAAE